ncbi:hypothetical protein C9426_34685 [Serratia sp. S1B]|nr:hypothetical protein C9426_34685 [Serratia sp. S1B]
MVIVQYFSMCLAINMRGEMNSYFKHSIYISMFFISISSYAIDKSPVDDENTDSQLFQKLFDEDERQRYLDYKKEQNSLPDNKRDKSLTTNQYLLVNKKQNYWLGLFDGKKVKVPKGVYADIPYESYQPQQIIRVKKDRNISQFDTSDNIDNYPAHCFNRSDYILKDELSYSVLFLECTLHDIDKNTEKHLSYYGILLYDKEYDTLIRLYSSPNTLEVPSVRQLKNLVEKTKNYYVYHGDKVAFKIIGKDKSVAIDYNTGKSQPKVPDRDPSTGKTIMIDDPEGFQPEFLKRLPEVITNK